MRKLSIHWVARIAVSLAVVAAAILFCFYPAVTLGILLTDGKLKREGQSRLVPAWFNALSGRYADWAEQCLESGFARKQTDVAGTEWPMFGSVYFLVTANELQRQGLVDARSGRVRRAVDKARDVVVSPDTATWVRAMWGDDYLTRENLFYRMLLIMGTAAYEEITGDTQCRAVMSAQRQSLAAEFMRAPLHMLDDYPGECWPSDVVWAVAALQRAAALEGTNHNEVARAVMASLDGPLNVAGLPAFKIDKVRETFVEAPRGCGNSGILSFAAELDPVVATRWYNAHERDFWKQNAWLAGFTELLRGSAESFSDIDSGPVIFGLGSVASAFGIGASKSVGRADRAAVLTMEAVACSWPTPFGFLLPMAMGKVAMGGSCLGETALLFSMTRPNQTHHTQPFTGGVPLLVWIMLLAYVTTGALLIYAEVRFWRRWRRNRKKET